MLAPTAETTLEVRTTETRYGTMHYYAGDTFIGNSLERYGEYSEAEPELWRKLIEPGDSVVDIGANIGTLTLALAGLVGESGKVLAIEAQTQNFRLLEQNVAEYLSHYLPEADSMIFPVHVALGDRCATIMVPALESLSHTNYGAVELMQGGGYEVDLCTLDELCGERRMDFIKIDVEGMEAAVLRGARNTIQRYRPILYVENDRAEKSAELLSLLDTMGYQVWDHRPPLYAPVNFKNAPLVDRPIISINALCLPNERVDEYKDVVSQLRRLYPPSMATAKQSIGHTTGNKNWACIVRVGGIGDNLIAASVLRPLKEQGYMTEVITQEPQCVVFENNPYLDKLTIKSPRELPQDNQLNWQKYWWSRSCEFKKFVNLSHTVEVLLARFPADTAFWWPFEYRRKLCGHSYLDAAHDVVDVPHSFGPLFFPTDAEKADIASFRQRNDLNDKPLISWIMAGTRVDKIYPLAGMAIARLLSEFDVNVIMLCAPAPKYRDVTFAEQTMNHVKMANSSTKGLYEARHIEGVHDWSIRRMITLAQMSELVIGPDSGVMWGVAFEDVPKIMLHSHASVDNITLHWKNTVSLHANQKRVPCWPCHLLHDGAETCLEMQMRAGLKPDESAPGAACISDISVSNVVAAVAAVLPEIDSGALRGLLRDFPGSVTLR
jgi:FkbM family methyltransferase